MLSLNLSEKCRKYDDMSDIFEYGNISDEEVVELCNQIITQSKEEKIGLVLEAMYHAVFTAVDCRDIGNKLEMDSILDSINNFKQEILDYIISILAFTGKRKYISVIKYIGEKYEDLDTSEAIRVLESRY